MGGAGKDAVLVAYAILQDGSMELLAGGNFVGGLKMWGLKDPLFICSDDNAGVINAIESHSTTSLRQRCIKHRRKYSRCIASRASGSGVETTQAGILRGLLARAGKGFREEVPNGFQKINSPRLFLA